MQLDKSRVEKEFTQYSAVSWKQCELQCYSLTGSRVRVLSLLSSFIVQLRLSTFNKVYDDDDDAVPKMAHDKNKSNK